MANIQKEEKYKLTIEPNDYDTFEEEDWNCCITFTHEQLLSLKETIDNALEN